MQFKTQPGRAVGLWREAFDRLELHYFQFKSATRTSLLQSCGSTKALLAGKCVHNHFERARKDRNNYVETLLLHRCVKSGCLKAARDWFDKMHERNVLSWNFMIGAYVRQGQPLEAFFLFELMQQEGVVEDKVTFIYMLSACLSLDTGNHMYASITMRGFESDIVVGTALVTMFGRCGCLEDAQKMFDTLGSRNVVSWNAILAVYSQNAQGKKSLELFNRMHEEGELPDKITYINFISGCSDGVNLSNCKRIHACIVCCGLESDNIVATALISVYGKCGRLNDAMAMFKKMHPINVVSWNAMITVHAWQGCSHEAFQIFNQMHHEGVMADNVTFVTLLDAFSNQAELICSKRLHIQIIQTGFEFDVVVATSLINVYGKCGNIDEARVVFDKMRHRNVISWNAMIAAYAQCGRGKEVFQLHNQMQGEGLIPNEITFVGILSACASLAALAKGKMIHGVMLHAGLDVGNALINMYGKCGSLEDAQRVFDEMHDWTGSSWNALISAYAHHGDGKRAVKLFEKMQHESVTMDDMTFMSVLSACSHDGLLVEGHQCLMLMQKYCGVTPTVEHYDCIIDLFCRAGQLVEAEELINKMPYPATLVSWTALLGAYRNHIVIE